MITPGYVRMMAGYNAEMNRRLYAAAAGLDDAERGADRGAFFGSIHATLCHLLWGDRTWMARFDGWPRPAVGIKGSVALVECFDELRAARVEADAAILDWSGRVTQGWLDGTLSWFSNAAARDMTASCAMLVTHFFNHQTHHRGQVHALLTRAGRQTGDTDLFLVMTEGSSVNAAG